MMKHRNACVCKGSKLTLNVTNEYQTLDMFDNRINTCGSLEFNTTWMCYISNELLRIHQISDLSDLVPKHTINIGNMEQEFVYFQFLAECTC